MNFRLLRFDFWRLRLLNLCVLRLGLLRDSNRFLRRDVEGGVVFRLLNTEVDECLVVEHATVIESVAVIGLLLTGRGFGFFLVFNGGWFRQQAHGTDFQRYEVFFVELVVVFVTVLRSQEFEVLVADNDDARFL